MKTIILLTALMFFIFSSLLFAQKENNNWYFGIKAGITFNTESGDPVALDKGQIITDEGTAVMSDNAGNLLFYTDGVKVWDKTHTRMNEETPLLGSHGSSNSAIIIPNPENKNIFYIFTADQAEMILFNQNKGINYSIIDMSLNNGTGEITDYNIPLYSPASEKLAAVRNYGNNSIWVISHEWNSNRFFAYQVTKDGVNHSAVISEIGIVHSGNTSRATGRLAISKDGTKLAVPVANHEENNGYLEIFDFDPNTGKVSNPQELELNKPVYSTVFSEDGTKLYVRITDSIVQFELDKCLIEDIKESKTTIAQNTGEYYYAMERGPNGKIYIISVGQSYLSEIRFPNLKGESCQYISNSIVLSSGSVIIGLPTLLQSDYYPMMDTLSICEGESAILEAGEFECVSEYLWYSPKGNFIQSDRMLQIDKTTLEDAGVYLCYISYSNANVDTLKYTLNIYPSPELSIEPNTPHLISCGIESVELTVITNDTNSTILWSTGETSDIIHVNESGYYWAKISNENGCSDSAGIKISIDPHFKNVEIGMPAGLSFCSGDSIPLTSINKYENYLWNTGETTNTIYAKEQGWYKLTGKNSIGCQDFDSVFVSEIPFNIGTNNILFDEVCLTSEVSKSEKISNLDLELEGKVISNIYLKNGRDFDVNFDDDLPFNLRKNNDFNYQIDFFPSSSGMFADTLVFEFTHPCNTTREIPIAGIVDKTADFNISIRDTLLSTGGRHCIPVWGKGNCDGLKFDSLIFTVKYHPDLFYLRELSKGVILDKSEKNGMIQVEILVEDIYLNNEKALLTELCGDLLLSERNETEISISNIYTSTEAASSSESGILSASDVCEEDMLKIIFGEIPEISINPNPSSDGIIKLAIEKGKDSKFDLSIYSALGTLVRSDSWSVNHSGRQEKIIDASDLPAGVYYAIVYSGAFVKQIKINLIK